MSGPPRMAAEMMGHLGHLGHLSRCVPGTRGTFGTQVFRPVPFVPSPEPEDVRSLDSFLSMPSLVEFLPRLPLSYGSANRWSKANTLVVSSKVLRGIAFWVTN